ncbi:protein tyrosine kinase [Ectocarpus siliculosus]|uniref:Protein tyrosine kinase n=1 Tax=Ectocarpus siliculosus TaxID=2880 RepID=D7FI62_ECTSI|nr:protein tyrosine kinase [Ectocarpus siliculosus]|eukprot:CBJ28688.1 protein tyrosine kinase [Ectocarpus siliculosus]
MMSSTATPRSAGTPAGPRLAPGSVPAAPPTATTPTRFYHNNEVPRLSKALSVVANLLKSPAKVSSRLFDVGKAIVLLALTQRFSPTSIKVRQLEQSSGADRSRGAVNTISTWARQVSKQRANKDQAVLELLDNAARAAPATKQTLLEHFGMGGTNPASVCKELSILLTALIKELHGEAGSDSPSPFSSSATSGDKGGMATAAAAPSADSATTVAAIATDDVVPRRRLPASTDSAVTGADTAVQASLEGVNAKSAIAIAATATADESKRQFRAPPATATAAEVGATAGDVVGPGKPSASSHNEENIGSAAATPGMVVPASLETGTPAPGVKSVSAAPADMAALCRGGPSSSRKCSALKVGKGEGGWGGGRGGGHLVKEGHVVGTRDGRSSTVRQGSNRQKPTVVNAGRPSAPASANAAARARSRGLAFIARPAGTPFSSGAGERGVPRDRQVKAAAANRAPGGVRGGGPRKQGCELSRSDRDGAVAAATALAAASAAAKPAAAAAGNFAQEKRGENDGVRDDEGAGGNHRHRTRPMVMQLSRPTHRPLRDRSQQDSPNTNTSAELRRTKGLLSKALSDQERLAAALVQQRKLHQEDVERHAAELREMRKENLVLDGQRSRLEALLLQAYRDMTELQGQKTETESHEDDESKHTSVPCGCPRPEEGGNDSGGGGGGDDDHHHEPSKHVSAGLPSPGSYAGSDASGGSGAEGTRGSDDHEPDGHDRFEEPCLDTALDRFNGVGFLASLLPLSGSHGGSGGARGDIVAGVVATEKGAKLGEGGGGGVFDLKIADEQLQGQFAAAGVGQGLVLKTLKKPKKGTRDTGMREIRMLASFMPTCHPNITNVFATNIATRSIVMEKMHMDLEHLLNHTREDIDRVSQDQMVRLICGAALGLKFMHEMGFAHGDVKPANMLVSDDLRECKISDFGSVGRLGVANVGDVTLPFTPPEAMGVANGWKVPLKASMDVWSFGMVVLQATSRARCLPTDHEVLGDHIHSILPTERQSWIAQAHEAMMVANDNFYYIACGRSKRTQEKASSDIIRLREVYFGTYAKTKKLDNFILSRRVWPDQRAFRHLPEVRKVLGAMMAVDPRERINMKTVALFLRHPGLWARTTTGLRAAASADAPGLPGAPTAPAAASPSPGDGSGKTSLDFKPVPETAHTLLSVLDEATNHDMVFTADGQVVPGDRAEVPSWLEVEMARKDGAWWQNVPIPTALARKAPRRQFRV